MCDRFVLHTIDDDDDDDDNDNNVQHMRDEDLKVVLESRQCVYMDSTHIHDCTERSHTTRNPLQSRTMIHMKRLILIFTILFLVNDGHDKFTAVEGISIGSRKVIPYQGEFENSSQGNTNRKTKSSSFSSNILCYFYGTRRDSVFNIFK